MQSYRNNGTKSGLKSDRSARSRQRTNNNLGRKSKNTTI